MHDDPARLDARAAIAVARGPSWLRGRRTLDEFSALVGLADLFPVEPIRDSVRFYRRWAFESAALDLALRRNGLSLQDCVGRVVSPVHFVVSVRLGEPASLAPLRPRRSIDPELHFKLDATASWDEDLWQSWHCSGASMWST
jgi:hypothetical protein